MNAFGCDSKIFAARLNKKNAFVRISEFFRRAAEQNAVLLFAIPHFSLIL
jgi:hypothetical protein